MFKRIAIVGLGIALLTTPLVTSADLLSDLQAQLVALQAKLTSVNVNANANAATNSSACPSLNASLSVGARGGDVTALQAFLIARGLLSSDSATGYFGLMTQGAVQRFQAQAGVVSSGNPSTTGYGMVGRMTREAIRNACGIGSNQPSTNVTFSASPVSGAAPLNVTFTEGGLPAGGYGVSFGDGSTGTITVPSITCITTPCNPGPQSTSHTYSLAGTYNVTLSGTPCAAGMSCAQVIRTLGTATVSVGSTPVTSAPSISSLSPAQGQAGTQVTVTGSNFTSTGNTVYFNGTAFSAVTSNGSTVTFTVPSNPCPIGVSCTAQVYYTPGTYTVSVSNSNGTSNNVSFTVTQQTLNSSVAPTISSLSPAQGQAGTQVTINGSNFTSTGNSVSLGSVGQQTVSSSNGTSLVFTVPNRTCPTGQSCTADYYMTPGTYPLTVTNANGTSNSMNFTVPERQTLDGGGGTPLPAPSCTDSVSSSVVAPGTYFNETWSSSSNATSMYLTVEHNGQNIVGPGPTGLSGVWQTKWDGTGRYNFYRTVYTQSGMSAQCSTTILVDNVSYTN